MTRSLSADIRGRVIAAIEDGVSTREAARRFRIGISTVSSISPPERLIFIDETTASRTIDDLWSVVADCLSAFTTEECRHYFEAAGYDPE